MTINVLGNDSAANGGTLTITAVGKPQFGTATTDGQTVTYTPNAIFVGNDSFSYFVSDGKGGVAAGSVTVTVTGPNGPNQAPTAAHDNVVTTLGTAVTINVLGNDSDPNGDALLSPSTVSRSTAQRWYRTGRLSIRPPPATRVRIASPTLSATAKVAPRPPR